MKKYIIKNSRIWTADEKHPWADCIAIKDKRIEYVGAYEDLNADEDFAEVDAQGKMMIPAFLDSHTHVAATAKTLWCLLPVSYTHLGN